MRPPWKRLLAFVLLFTAMYVALSQAWAEGLSRWIIDLATVEPAAWIARNLTGQADILAAGSRLISPRASINVANGCEGPDVLMLLASALLAAPAPWRDKLLGLGAGTAFVFALNQARVLALYFALRDHRAWFGPLHGLIAPLAVVSLVAAFFLAWVRWTTRTPVRGACA
jgi:exosortase/archaeosortase family protein